MLSPNAAAHATAVTENRRLAVPGNPAGEHTTKPFAKLLNFNLKRLYNEFIKHKTKNDICNCFRFNQYIFHLVDSRNR